MLTIVMAEDSPTDAAIAQSLISQFLSEENVEARLIHFDNGTELLAHYPHEASLFLLDIDMSQLDGLSTAHRIRKIDPDVSICFMTNYGKLALEGYSVDAMGFMVKPLSYPVLKSTLKRVMNRIARKQTYLVPIRQGKQQLFIDANQIMYIETKRKGILIHMAHEAIASNEPLKAIELKLANKPFFRIHNAFLVNLDYIQTITANDAMVGTEALPISKHRKKEFLIELTRHVGRNV